MIHKTITFLVLILCATSLHAFEPDTIIEKSGSILTGNIVLRNGKPVMLISPSGNYQINPKKLDRYVIENEYPENIEKRKVVFFPSSRNFNSSRAKKLYFISIIFASAGITLTTISYFRERPALRYVGFPSILIGFALVLPVPGIERKANFQGW
jgi:hypothetical protein